MKPTLLGTGIFTWNGHERRSDRYGAFYLTDASYDGHHSASHPTIVDAKLIRALVGKRVRLFAKSVEKRKSGHCGDLFHKVFPKPLAKGKTLEIGMGMLSTGETDTGELTFILHPEDGRATFWIDPRILFQLHDQTVELYGEESTASAHAPFVAASVGENSAIGVDSTTLQYKTTSTDLEGLTLSPIFERLGNGLFSVTQQTLAAGQRVKIERR